MSSSSDLPVGFLGEVFRAGCQCSCCKAAKAEIARLREAIKREAWNHRSRSRGEFGIDCVCDICEIAREEKS